MNNPYFPELTSTAGGAYSTYFCTLWPAQNMIPQNWQAALDAWVEYGYWMRVAEELQNLKTHRIYYAKGGSVLKRFRGAFGKRMAADRAQRIAMCGLMMAMCQEDANNAMRGVRP